MPSKLKVSPVDQLREHHQALLVKCMAQTPPQMA